MSAKHGPMGAYDSGTKSQNMDSAAVRDGTTKAATAGIVPTPQQIARNQGTARASRPVSLPIRTVVPRRTAVPPMPCINDNAPPASPRIIWCERTRNEGLHHRDPNAQVE